jgi:hypothetical protein
MKTENSKKDRMTLNKRDNQIKMELMNIKI